MGIICLYVLIQKSGQKTAKSHLCALLRSGSEWPFDQALLLMHSRNARKFYDPKMKRIHLVQKIFDFHAWVKKCHLVNFFFILGSYNFLAYLQCVRSYAWSKDHSDPDLSSVVATSLMGVHLMLNMQV